MYIWGGKWISICVWIYAHVVLLCLLRVHEVSKTIFNIIIMIGSFHRVIWWISCHFHKMSISPLWLRRRKKKKPGWKKSSDNPRMCHFRVSFIIHTSFHHNARQKISICTIEKRHWNVKGMKLTIKLPCGFSFLYLACLYAIAPDDEEESKST